MRRAAAATTAIPTPGEQQINDIDGSNSYNALDSPVAPAPPSFVVDKTRIIDRDGEFKQSLGRWNIERKKDKRYSRLYLNDPFHSIINTSTTKVWLGLTFVYLFILLVYACFYLAVPNECKLNITSYQQALYFSVETQITIGYGAQGGDIFFNDCLSPLVLILSQSLMGVFLNALSIGIVFTRFSRGQSRATTVIFSNQACVRRIRGHLYFMFQVCEMRKHQLTEAHVRCYTVRHDKEESDDNVGGTQSFFQTYPMRLQHPDDELGGMLLMALPSVVVHRIDAWSPLSRRVNPPTCAHHHEPSKDYLFPEPFQRAADQDAGNREEFDGKSREDDDAPPKENPTEAVHSCNDRNCPESTHTSRVSVKKHYAQLQQLREYWEGTNLEVVVLLEGIDAASSFTIQARHSYKSNEILLDHVFSNCVLQDPQDPGRAIIDFKLFHKMTPSNVSCNDVRGSFY